MLGCRPYELQQAAVPSTWSLHTSQCSCLAHRARSFYPSRLCSLPNLYLSFTLHRVSSAGSAEKTSSGDVSSKTLWVRVISAQPRAVQQAYAFTTKAQTSSSD